MKRRRRRKSIHKKKNQKMNQKKISQVTVHKKTKNNQQSQCQDHAHVHDHDLILIKNLVKETIINIMDLIRIKKSRNTNNHIKQIKIINRAIINKKMITKNNIKTPLLKNTRL